MENDGEQSKLFQYLVEGVFLVGKLKFLTESFNIFEQILSYKLKQGLNYYLARATKGTLLKGALR